MSSGLWTAYESAAATNGILCARGGDPGRWVAEEWIAKGISIDTRTITPGDMFVALKDARDGHEFLQDAFTKGASAALVAKAPANAPEGVPFLLVQDTLEGLSDLAKAAKERNFGKRIGITGSVGKTSTKEMLRAALSEIGAVHAADRSFNNHWGVPLTLARMPADTDFGVFEIGMNHAGEITPLTKLVAPDVAVITTVAPAHLEFFPSVEAIAQAKAEIFLGVADGGTCVLPIDNPHFELLRQKAIDAGVSNVLTFGEAPEADVRLSEYRTDGSKGFIAACVKNGGVFEFSLSAPGKHQALNALAVLAVVTALKLPMEKAIKGLEAVGAADGRGQQHEIKLPGGVTVCLLDESYNANPMSMAAALNLLGTISPRENGRRIAILGEMLELGANGPRYHAEIAEHLEAADVSCVFAVGELMAHLWAALDPAVKTAHANTADEIVESFLETLENGDVVMVKGSNASKVSKVVSALKERSL